MTPKLWISPGACSLLPHILLREAGLSFELVKVDITQERLPEEVRRINPKMRVPILVLDDGTIITETVAISTWISQQVPEKGLFGKTNLDIVRSYEWLNWLSGTVHERGLGGLFSPSWFAADESAYVAVQTKSREWVDKCFGDIETKLARTHAVGDDFTVVDCFLYVFYRWGYLLSLDMESLYPKWAALALNVAKRDSVKGAVETEGIPLIRDDRLAPKQHE